MSEVQNRCECNNTELNKRKLDQFIFYTYRLKFEIIKLK